MAVNMDGELDSSDKYAAVAVPAGAKSVLFFADPTIQGKTAQSLRVAVHSATKGYSQIITVSINGSTAVAFQLGDVNGLSLERQDAQSNWAPVSWVVA